MGGSPFARQGAALLVLMTTRARTSRLDEAETAMQCLVCVAASDIKVTKTGVVSARQQKQSAVDAWVVYVGSSRS